MLFGVGIDLVDIDRMQRVIAAWGDRFLSRMFTKNEIAYCCEKANAAQCFAARFAAKEALAKALGHGWCEHFKWTDVEVTRDRTGKPALLITGITSQLVAHKRIHLSLSHSNAQAAAVVTVEDI